MRAWPSLQADRPLLGIGAVVVGAGRGLGRVIAEAYALAGSSVVVVSRTAAELEAVAMHIRRVAPDVAVQPHVCDIADPEQVERLAEVALGEMDNLRVLVNSAAVLGPSGPAASHPAASWVETLQINLVGAVVLCNAFVPAFRAAGRGKVIQVSGGGATGPAPGIAPYAASKAAVVRFCETLALELRGTGVDVNCLAPGLLPTEMLRELVDGGPAVLGPDAHARAVDALASGDHGLQEAAALAVLLGSPASDGLTGRLISAVWDNWCELPSRREAIMSGDLYTVRRVASSAAPSPWDGPPPTSDVCGESAVD